MGFALLYSGYPARLQDARSFDAACQTAFRTATRSGCKYEYGTVLQSWDGQGPQMMRLVVSDGDTPTVTLARGNVNSLVPGCRVTVHYWHGQVARILWAGRQADTWDNPDWVLVNTVTTAAICALAALIAITPSIFWLAKQQALARAI